MATAREFRKARRWPFFHRPTLRPTAILTRARDDRSRAIDDCVDACNHCVEVCNETAHHCCERAEDGDTDHLKAMHYALDCQELCAASAKLCARHSPLMAVCCQACATACEACAKVCDESDDDQMEECADACREVRRKLPLDGLGDERPPVGDPPLKSSARRGAFGPRRADS